jgi:glucokinase
MTETVLVADIGGTNARFALAKVSSGGVSVGAMSVFRAEDFETIRHAADAFLQSVDTRPTRACFAVAGPITDDVVEFTNSPWVLDIRAVQAALGLEDLIVINDFAALARGVEHLTPEDYVLVRPGAGDPATPILVIGPGTGLGQSILVPSPSGRRVVATEGGHVAFAPTNDEEIEVLKFLLREYERVSIERLLSGRGLVNIHRALCAIAGAQRISLQADEITKAAMTREHPIAAKAVDFFCAVLGSAVGDAVLATGARGGVVLGGGILPKIQEVFLASRFGERFLDKGRMREFVEDVPIHLIVRDGAALVGAAGRLREARLAR